MFLSLSVRKKNYPLVIFYALNKLTWAAWWQGHLFTCYTQSTRGLLHTVLAYAYSQRMHSWASRGLFIFADML